MKKIILFFILLWSVNCMAQDWQSCGKGVQGIPYETYVGSMAADTDNNILYAGGDFDTINDTTAVGYIARWNGTTWSSIPALDSISYAFYNTDEQAYTIDAMIMYNGALYLPASVTFNGNGTNYTNYYVIKYDGKTVQWLPALDGQVNCFTVYNETLYIGGDFVEPDTTIFNHVAKWDGTNWEPVGSGFILYSNSYAATLYSLGVSNGKLIAGGSFDQSGNTTDLYSIAQWDDTGWIALGKGVRNLDTILGGGIVYSIGSYQNNLYVGGEFGYAGEDTAFSIAEWNGSKWLSLNQQFSGDGILGLQEYDNKLYVGGGANIGRFQGNQRIASWDGTQWDTVSAEFDNAVYSLTVFQNSLYVGGIFDSTSNMLVNYITHWSPDSIFLPLVLSVNTPPPICSTKSDTLIVTGAENYTWFPSTGLSATSGDTVIANPTVTTIYTVAGTNLNGSFGVTTVVVVVNPNPIISLNIPPPICKGDSTTLTVSGGATYSWSPSKGLGSTTGSSIIGSPDTTTTYLITAANSSGCSATDSVIVIVMPSPNQPTIGQHSDTLVSSATHDNQWYHNDTLLVGDTNQDLIISELGWYRVNVTYSNGCGAASDSIDIDSLSGINRLTITNQLTIFPNPFSQQTTLQFSQPITNNTQLTLYDLTGREVESNIISNGSQNFAIKRNGLPDGMYFYRLIVQDGQQYAGKIIVEK